MPDLPSNKLLEPPRLEVRVRHATSTDLPSIADVCAQAMLDDEWFVYACPERRRYYRSFRDAFLRRTKQRMVEPGYVLTVATTTSINYGDDEIACKIAKKQNDEVVVGYCVWERRGNDEHAKRWRREKGAGLWSSKSFS
jgi:hypothetical protein